MPETWQIIISVEPNGTFGIGTSRDANGLEIRMTLLNVIGTLMMAEAQGEKPPALVLPDQRLVRA